MTDPPIDNTQAREQDAPGTYDAKRRPVALPLALGATPRSVGKKNARSPRLRGTLSACVAGGGCCRALHSAYCASTTCAVSVGPSGRGKMCAGAGFGFGWVLGGLVVQLPTTTQHGATNDATEQHHSTSHAWPQGRPHLNSQAYLAGLTYLGLRLRSSVFIQCTRSRAHTPGTGRQYAVRTRAA
eukprot:scaffold6040_cov132-Isochrysis_galbana.AAC.4